MKGPKIYVSATLLSILAWQSYFVLRIHAEAPVMAVMWDDFGGKLPAISEFFQNTYRFSSVVSLLSVVLTFDVLRRKPTPYAYAAFVFAVIALSSLALHALARKAFWAPLRNVAKALQ